MVSMGWDFDIILPLRTLMVALKFHGGGVLISSYPSLWSSMWVGFWCHPDGHFGAAWGVRSKMMWTFDGHFEVRWGGTLLSPYPCGRWWSLSSSTGGISMPSFAYGHNWGSFWCARILMLSCLCGHWWSFWNSMAGGIFDILTLWSLIRSSMRVGIWYHLKCGRWWLRDALAVAELRNPLNRVAQQKCAILEVAQTVLHNPGSCASRVLRS